MLTAPLRPQVLVGLMSALGALMMIEAIALIKGNEKFEQRVEFSSVAYSSLFSSCC